MSKLPILMYHKVSSEASNGLEIGVENLEAQFRYLSENGYKSYHLSELAQLQKLPSKKNIVITFDDGYVNQLQYAVPLLQKYQLKATFFIPLKYVGKEDQWNETTSPIMDAETLRSLDPSIIELGYHSFAHNKYDELSMEAIEEDTIQAFKVVEGERIPLGPTLAYPYGKFPRKQPEKGAFFKLLEGHQFVYGLRIGNRLNAFPFKNPFEIQRLDVKGEWSLKKFRRKIKYGKIF